MQFLSKQEKQWIIKITVIHVSKVAHPKKSEATLSEKRGREYVKYEIANFNDKGLRHTNISYETNTWEKVGPLINESKHIISGD